MISAIIGLIFGIIKYHSIKKYINKLYDKKYLKILLIIFMIFNVVYAVLCACFSYLKEDSNLVISEVCSHNFNLLTSPRGEYSDYIELYNNSDKNINLNDFYLSDDKENIKKYRMPNYTLKTYSYVVIWLDGNHGTDEYGIYGNFRISDNEIVFLSNKKGELINSKDKAINTKLTDDGLNLTAVFKKI